MRASERGLTLIELLASIGSMLVLMATISSVIQGSTRGRASSTRLALIREEGNRALELMVRDLRAANSGALLITGDEEHGSTMLEFVIPVGVVGEEVTWSTPVQYSYGEEEAVKYGSERKKSGGIKAANEIKLGKLLRAQGGRENVVCHHVREDGFRITPGENGNLYLELDLAIVDHMGRLLTATVDTSVTLRNNTGG